MKDKIAVLIPCLNEELTIGKVVRDFREQLPEAEIHVFDNASTDSTRQIAQEAGAIVHAEERRGKGYVVQSMFQTVEADIYVMVDGDDTYPAEVVHDLIGEVAADNADMVVGSRFLAEHSSFRTLNRLGNQLFLGVINGMLGTRLTDVLSGYRAMSRRLVKGLPLFVRGFEIEVEMTIKTLTRDYRLIEKPAQLRDRPEGSHSKIRKLRDGSRILWTIFALVRDYKPLTAFGLLGLLVLGLSAVPGLLMVRDYLQTGSLSSLPAAVLAVGLALCGVLSMATGLVLHTVARRFQELDYLIRLNQPVRRTVGGRGQRPKRALSLSHSESPGDHQCANRAG